MIRAVRPPEWGIDHRGDAYPYSSDGYISSRRARACGGSDKTGKTIKTNGGLHKWGSSNTARASILEESLEQPGPAFVVKFGAYVDIRQKGA